MWEACVSPTRTVRDRGGPPRPRRSAPRIIGLVLAALLAPLAVLAFASPASAETCFAGTSEKGCISGTVRTEKDVVAGVDVHVTGPNGFDETATSDDAGKWSVTVLEPGEYTAELDEETLPEGTGVTGSE